MDDRSVPLPPLEVRQEAAARVARRQLSASPIGLHSSRRGGWLPERVSGNGLGEISALTHQHVKQSIQGGRDQPTMCGEMGLPFRAVGLSRSRVCCLPVLGRIDRREN